MTTTYSVDLAGIGPVEVIRRRIRGRTAVPAAARRGRSRVGDRIRREVRRRAPGSRARPDPSRVRRHPRPEALDSIAGLAALYQALLDQLDLTDVTVIGNSIGGWITAEIALLKSPRVSGIVLIDAVGIEVPGHPVADFFSLTMDQVFTLSFHNPDPFRIDPSDPPARCAGRRGRQPSRDRGLRRRRR